MRILLIADGRSPITRSWIIRLIDLGFTPTLISSFPCDESLVPVKTYIIPVALSKLARQQGFSASSDNYQTNQEIKNFRRLITRFRSIFLQGRYWLGPASLYFSNSRLLLQEIIEKSQPDLVHALRIPFEGMLGSFSPPNLPLAVSIWGNDLTLHARGSPWMGRLTRRTMRRANGLLADAHRDLRLASSWGYPGERPTLFVPGSGGIDFEKIAHCKPEGIETIAGLVSRNAPLVINPRGFRPGSLRMDTFFKAIPLILEKAPETIFLCPSLAGQGEAIHWLKKLGIETNVRLLPDLPQEQLWALFHRSQVYVSPSIHDGTPNSFLEAMVCGCFPVVGNIESFAEWITPGVNGFLVDATDAHSLAEAISNAIDSPDLRHKAAVSNNKLVAERAEVGLVKAHIKAFYEQVIRSGEK